MKKLISVLLAALLLIPAYSVASALPAEPTSTIDGVTFYDYISTGAYSEKENSYNVLHFNTNDGYVPITFGEFIGTNPVEKSVTSSSLSGLTTVTPAQLAEMTVTSNYSISYVRYSVTDKTGSEIHRQIAFPYSGLGCYEMDVATWVKPEDFLPFSGERLTVTCRISTGETVTLFDGTIA